MDLDFTAQGFFHFRCLNHALVQLFNGNFDPGWFVQGQLDLPVGPFSKLAPFELKLFESHACEHFLIRVSLPGHSQLARLYERG